MKKMTVLVAAVLCMLFSIPVNADEDATYEELQSYEEDILISANSIIPDESIQASDLDYDKTIKVYENVDLFSYSEIDNEIIEEAIIGKEYIYLIPVYKNNKTYFLTVSMGKSVNSEVSNILSEEDLSIINQYAGHWYVPEVRVLNGTFDPQAMAQECFETNEGILYFGGTIGYKQLIAVCDIDNEIRILPFEDFDLTGTESVEDSSLSFEEMKLEKVNYNYNDDETTGYSSSEYNEETQRSMSCQTKLIVGLCILCLVAATVYFNVRRAS